MILSFIAAVQLLSFVNLPAPAFVVSMFSFHFKDYTVPLEAEGIGTDILGLIQSQKSDVTILSG